MKSSIAFFTKSSCYMGALFIVLASVACNYHKNKDRNSTGEHLDQLISIVDNLVAKTQEPGGKITDSIYYSSPHPTIEDLCDKYLLKSYYSQPNYSRQEQYADSALWIIRNNELENRYTSLYGRAYLYKGKALLQLREYNEAYACYYEGIKVIQSTHDTLQFSQFSGRLGTVCYEQGDYLHAVNYFRECFQEKLKYQTGKNDFLRFREQQGNLDNIGLCYSKSGMPDSAIYYFYKALDYINTYGPQLSSVSEVKEFIDVEQGVIYGNLGTAYFNKGDFKTAETFYNKTISINKREGMEISDAHLTQLKLAELYLKTSRLDEANALLQHYRATIDSGRRSDKHLATKWYKLEADYYNLMQQPDKAGSYLNIYTKQTDSITAANKKFVSIDFNKAYEDINQQDSFLTLKKENETQNESNIIVIFFLAATIGVAIFVSKSNKQLKELNQQVIKQNKEMHQALDALEQSHKENTRMMEVVAHDLRDPLATIKSMATLLTEEEVDNKTQQEFLSLIQTSSSALLAMISDVLSTNIAKEEMRKEPVNMKELLQYCVDMMKFKAHNKKQDIILQADDCALEIDREKIWRVLNNLINNAIKFSPEATTIKVEMHKEQDAVQISIKDSSSGISDELMDKVFEEVTETNKVITPRQKLPFSAGLFISKQIVEALGGRIWVESKKDEGTTFYIEFPKEMITTRQH